MAGGLLARVATHPSAPRWLASGLKKVAGFTEGLVGPRGRPGTGASTELPDASSEIPARLARVVPGEGPWPTLGPPDNVDVFVTAADDIVGLDALELSRRLGIPESSSFTVIEFAAPVEGVASPILRSDPGFVGGGVTSGGAREFVVPNGPVPPDATVRLVGK